MKIAIIGSGISGLMSAALFSSEGHQVTIFEQNKEIGGVTSLKRHKGFSWEQGPLLLGDFLPGEKGHQALKELGIELEMVRGCRGIEMPDYSVWRPKEYEGPDWRKNRLKELFPKETKGIDQYYKIYEKMMRLANPIGKDNFYRKVKTMFLLLSLKKYSKMSAQDLMDHLFNDEKIKTLFTGILADFCASPNEFIGLGVPYLNIETAFDKRIPLTDNKGHKRSIGFGYFKGGVSKLPEALANKTIENGGKIITDVIVDKILIENNTVKGIRLKNSEIHQADIVIASGGAREVFQDLVGYEYLDDNYKSILDTFKPMESVFMLHLGVDFNPLKYQKTELCYYYKTYDLDGTIQKLRNGIYHEGEEGFLIYVPSAHSPEMAPKGYHCVTIYTVAPDHIEGKDWEKEKEHYASKLISLAEKHLPGLEKHIIEKRIMTPVDYRKLAHLKKSAFGGIVPINGIKNPTHKTPVSGLYFVGQQSENGGGVFAVMMGAKDTWHLIKKEKRI